MADIKIIARPWQPQDLLDDLQEIIDEESNNYLNTRRTTLCMAKSFLEEHFAKQKWIPVTERLPEKDGTYIVFTLSRCVTTARFYPEHDFCNYRGEFIEHKPGRFHRNATHWMPLPEPPKGE